MIFKVSLFLAALSIAEARMRGEATEKEARKLQNSMRVPLTAVRSINGAENELAAPDAELQRFSGPAHYPDGQGIDNSFFTTPNPRTISNIVATMPDGISTATVTDAFWQWGQVRFGWIHVIRFDLILRT